MKTMLMVIALVITSVGCFTGHAAEATAFNTLYILLVMATSESDNS